MKEQIVAQARKSADEEGRKMIATAKDSIEKEKQSAMNELKTTAALIGVEIAEKIIRRKVGTPQEQEALIGEYLKEFKLN